MGNFFSQDARINTFQLKDLNPLMPIKIGGQSQIFESQAFINEKNQRVIVKLYGTDQQSLRWFNTEFNILRYSDHQAIIKLLGRLDHPKGPALILKKASNFSFAHIIYLLKAQDQILDPLVIRYILKRLLNALGFLHCRIYQKIFPYGVVHSDISSHNIMLSLNGRCFLIDFGAAVTDPRRAYQAFGLQRFLAPEQFMGFVTKASDLYSLGSFIFELCLKRGFNLDRMGNDFDMLSIFLGEKNWDIFMLLRAMLAPSLSLRPPNGAVAAKSIRGVSKKEASLARNQLALLIKDLYLINR
jgi:serine/threonine protein kinase